MKKFKGLSKEEMKKVLGGAAESELGCTPPGGMCNSHDECCKSMEGPVICLVNTVVGSPGYGFGFCTKWF